MNELAKTIAFVVFGLGLATTAYFVNQNSQPKMSDAAELIGQPFYPTFTSAGQAKSLKVTAIDLKSAELRSFSVQNKDGLWRIPSHHGYPAEAAERLAATATSVIGIVRESRAGDLSASHERYGLIDPETYDERGTEGLDIESFGNRITLLDEAGEVLVDYIVGHEVKLDEDTPFAQEFKQDSGEKLHYVRRADETQSYIVNLNIDLSTKFSEWIDPDLLEVDATELRRIEIDNYELLPGEASPLSNIRPMKKAQKDQLLLTRNESVEPWSLKGFDAEKEELVEERVTEIVSVLDEMKIVGVRPKLTYQGESLLTPELQVNQLPDFQKDPVLFQQLMERLQDEMDENGFNFVNDGGIKLVSQFGQVNVGTKAGVLYQLQFGAKVSGDNDEIEIGGVAKKDDDDAAAGDETAAEEDEPETTEATSNRFLMIRAVLDESLLGVKPQEPVKPTAPVKPEGYVPVKTAAEKKETDARKGDAATGENAKDDQDAGKGDEATQEPDRDPAFVEYDRLLKEFEEASVEYELIKTRYADRIKEYNEKVAAGNKRVADLNDRFGKWYYVISSDNLSSLQSARVDIVKRKAGEPEPDLNPDPDSRKPAAILARPDISFEFPEGLWEAVEAEKAAAQAGEDSGNSKPGNDESADTSGDE